MITPDINLKEFAHHLPVQLRFNDIDILGHLNNIVYFSLFDLAKARYLEAVQHGKQDWQKVECVIGNVNCTYLQQVRFGDNVAVATRVVRIGDRSFTLRQALYNADTEAVHAVCDTTMVCFDPDTGTSAPMRPALRQALESEQSPTLR